jgi:hypothetical protein
MPIALFLIRNQEDLMWKQHLEALSDPEVPHFHAGMAVLAEYTQYIFNLQDNTARTIIQQHLHFGSLEQHAEELRHENAILCSPIHFHLQWGEFCTAFHGHHLSAGTMHRKLA